MGVVDEVRERIDIVEFISSYVSLKKAGHTYKGLCPFHAEKTPSFVVFPQSQTWHCFGACGTGGTVFDFLMRYEGLDFSEALRQLAERAGVPLRPATPETVAGDQQRELLVDIHQAAAQFFHNLLRQSPEGATARNYLEQRAINAQTIEQFQLGYAPDAWEGLKTHLVGRGYSENHLEQAGLIIQKQESGSSYDRFRNRLVIPIRNKQGQVIGFGARALNPNDVPKYLNSPQTLIFDKGSILFGMDLAKQSMRDKDQVVIVEGYMDVLSAHQNGHNNVVAGMGTSLTEAQLKQVGGLTKNLVLALDADSAGSAATLRGIDTAREALDRSLQPVADSQGLFRFEQRLNVDIRIATLPTGRDPDDILRQSPEEWPHIVNRALPVVSFYIERVAEQLDLNSAKGKSTLTRQVLPLLREIGDPVERSHYVGRLAELVKVDERVLLADLSRPSTPAPRQPARRGIGRADKDEPSDSRIQSQRFGPEEYTLVIMLKEPSVLASTNAELNGLGFGRLSDGDFSDVQNRALFTTLSQWAMDDSFTGAHETEIDNTISQQDALLHLHLEFLRRKGDALPYVPGHVMQEELISRVLSLRAQNLHNKIANLRFLEQEAIEADDHEEWRRYHALVLEASHALHSVQRAIFDRSITGRRRGEMERQGFVSR